MGLSVYTIVLAVIAYWYLRAKEGALLNTVFVSPLPAVRLAEEEAVPDSKAYQREYDFTSDWFTWNIPVWEKALASVKGKPNLQYLEIGLYEGRSAIWMLENILTHPSARLTGVDIFDGPLRERYFANIERAGSAEKVTTLIGRSQLVLRELPVNSFDIVYVDGSHAQDDVLEDAVLCWRLLRDDGLLIFDDYRWAHWSGIERADIPKVAIDAFVQCFEEHFEVLHNSWQLILRKKSHTQD